MNKREPENTEPKIAPWLSAIKASSPYVLVALVGAVLASSLEIADRAMKVTDRWGWTRSEALSLAINSDRSKFSDSLIRNAWKRLLLADIFVRRVQDGAASVNVEEAWKAYVDSLIDWNADLMINIVGLETFYDQRKSRYFEDEIQLEYIVLDSLVRAVYLSPYVKQLLSIQPRDSNYLLSEKGPIDAAFEKTEAMRGTLYFFVRCFRKGDKPYAGGCLH